MLRPIFSYFTGDYVIFENMSSYQPYVQINIKRCHSDGCDTRIRGVKTLGYRRVTSIEINLIVFEIYCVLCRVVKEEGVSVLDASAIWFLQVSLSLLHTSIVPLLLVSQIFN